MYAFLIYVLHGLYVILFDLTVITVLGKGYSILTYLLTLWSRVLL